VCIFHWGPLQTYLLHSLFPDALRVEAHIGEPFDSVLTRVPDGADHFFFHVDLTESAKMPLGRARLGAALRANGVRPLNDRVTCISKHRLQDACAALGLNTTRTGPHGDPSELVIVKTSRNFGGVRERALSADECRLLGISESGPSSAGSSGYVVVVRRDVRRAVWQSRGLIVERFIENREQAYYRVHVLGGHMVIARIVSPKRIKKMPAGMPRENWFVRSRDLELAAPGPPVPIRVTRTAAMFCDGFGLDYGSLDIVYDDDERYFIVDVNATPNWRRAPHSGMFQFLVAGLAARR
jgi:hypothetical protein